MKQIFIVLIPFMIFIQGCSVKETPAVTEYTLTKPVIKFDTSQQKCHLKTLKVLSPFASSEYSTNELHYVVGGIEEGKFHQSKWGKAPTTTLYNAVVNTLREQNIFKNVANYTSIGESDYALEIEINEFKQHFSSDLLHSYVVADVTFTLIDRKGFVVLDQKRIYTKLPVTTLDAKGGIKGLNEALKVILQEMLHWIDGAC